MRLTARELRGQLTILAVVLWGLAAVNAATPSWRLRSGQIKGTDFVHFYTLARLGAEGRAGLFFDLEAQRRVQLEARPESSEDWYPPAYGPQVALLLAPLGLLTYGWALFAWLALTAVLYLIAIGAVIRRSEVDPGHFKLAMLAAAAYPPFWNLIQHGQLSILALISFLAAWGALRGGHPFWAGAALGILAYKPPLLVPVACVLVLAAEWRMLTAAAVTAGIQLVASVWWVGLAGLYTYGDLLLASPRLALVLTARPSQMHSWRSFWSLLVPEPRVAFLLYALSAIATIVLATLVWRRLRDWNLRVATLLIATVLASPHLYVYDLVLLAPAWIWLTQWYLGRVDLPANVGRALYIGYAAPLFGPVAAVFHVQVSTLCFGGILFLVWRYGTAHQGAASARNHNQLNDANA